jgi:hypothetical protein
MWSNSWSGLLTWRGSQQMGIVLLSWFCCSKLWWPMLPKISSFPAQVSAVWILQWNLTKTFLAVVLIYWRNKPIRKATANVQNCICFGFWIQFGYGRACILGHLNVTCPYTDHILQRFHQLIRLQNNQDSGSTSAAFNPPISILHH